MAALLTVWMDAISSDPMLLRGAVDKGLHKLGYPAIIEAPGNNTG